MCKYYILSDNSYDGLDCTECDNEGQLKSWLTGCKDYKGNRYSKINRRDIASIIKGDELSDEEINSLIE